MAIQSIHDVAAPAKLNLFLHVTGKRADGYHLLESVFVLIDWSDTLHFERRSDGGISRRDLGLALPVDDLCLRAARALQAASASRIGVEISIEKRIPWGAGMGGASSDAASTLLALNRLWALHWPLERLAEIGLQIGADVPFFLGGGAAFVAGVGERLTPLALPRQWFAVIKPAASLETHAVFQSPLVGRSEGGAAATIEGLAGSALSGRPGQLESGTDAAARAKAELQGRDFWNFGRNDLQAAAEAECAEVAEAAAVLRKGFGTSRMTGSGSAVFAWAGGGDEPQGRMPAALPVGWTGRMCRTLGLHPLSGWAD